MTCLKMEIVQECYGVEDKIPKAQRSASAVYLPLSWSGKKVRVLLLEPLEEER